MELNTTKATQPTIDALREINSIASSLAADLLEMDAKGAISLSTWSNAQEFVSATIEYCEAPNGY